MWAITSAMNQYEQYGDYLITVFSHKPSMKEINECLGGTREFAKWILKGGGRLDFEDEWYYLTEIHSGEIYIAK